MFDQIKNKKSLKCTRATHWYDGFRSVHERCYKLWYNLMLSLTWFNTNKIMANERLGSCYRSNSQIKTSKVYNLMLINPHEVTLFRHYTQSRLIYCLNYWTNNSGLNIRVNYLWPKRYVLSLRLAQLQHVSGRVKLHSV